MSSSREARVKAVKMVSASRLRTFGKRMRLAASLHSYLSRISIAELVCDVVKPCGGSLWHNVRTKMSRISRVASGRLTSFVFDEAEAKRSLNTGLIRSACGSTDPSAEMGSPGFLEDAALHSPRRLVITQNNNLSGRPLRVDSVDFPLLVGVLPHISVWATSTQPLPRGH